MGEMQSIDLLRSTMPKRAPSFNVHPLFRAVDLHARHFRPQHLLMCPAILKFKVINLVYQ